MINEKVSYNCSKPEEISISSNQTSSFGAKVSPIDCKPTPFVINVTPIEPTPIKVVRRVRRRCLLLLVVALFVATIIVVTVVIVVYFQVKCFEKRLFLCQVIFGY